MIKNKKLLIALICFAFCVCCAIFGIGFKSKNEIVAQADTIQPATTKTATATVAKSISLIPDEIENFSTITEEPVTDEPEENQDITYEEDIETEEPEDEIIEEDNDNSDITEYDFVTPTPPIPPMRKTVTFRGHVNWIDDDGIAHPLRQIKIQITDHEDSDFTIYTDDKGYFTLTHSFLVFNKIQIIAYAIDIDENIKITNRNGELHSYVLKSEISIPPTTTSSTVITLEDLAIDMSTTAGQAFQISQAIITARDFAKEMMGKMPSPITVFYPAGFTQYGYDEIYIMQGLPINGIVGSYASWDTIMHEYGHHISRELKIMTELHRSYIHSLSMDLAYEYGKYYGVHIAWQEAWPTVFGMIAQQYYVERGILADIKTVGDTLYNNSNEDINAPEYNTFGIAYGEASEGAVVAVLWDLFDDDIEENDTIALGYQGFWDITTKKGTKTFSDFIKNFYNTYPDLIDAIGDNLSYYRIAPTYLTVYDNCYETTPTLTWFSGLDTNEYRNNKFVVKFYTANKELIWEGTAQTETSYKVFNALWVTILESEGSYFYWSVEAMNVHAEEPPVTGPYIVTQKVMKPVIDVMKLTLLRKYLVYDETEYKWYEFEAPSNGTYSFYTEGASDTIGDLYGALILYPNKWYKHDDDSGTDRNFKITTELSAGDKVYLRVTVKTFFLHYSVGVSMEPS